VLRKSAARAISSRSIAARGPVLVTILVTISFTGGSQPTVPLECYPEQNLGDRSWTKKRFLLWRGVIFAVVALFHLVRIFAEWTVIIGDWSVPKWVSWVALIVAGGLALFGLRLGQR
jgi:hypothetical protein